MNKRRIIPIVVILVVVAVAAAVYAMSRPRKDDNAVRISGNIEVVDTELSFRIPGRVATRPVDEGMTIRRGALVATLDPTELQHDIAQQTANLNAAQAQLLELEHGSRIEDVRSAQAAVSAAGAEVQRWDKELDRERHLFTDGIIPKAQLEVTEATARASHDKLEQASQTLKTLVAGPRVEEIAAARARAAQAQAALAESQTRLGFTTLTSPVDGVVLSRNIEPGEQVAAGTPVVTAADLGNIWLRGYIDETDLGRVHLGQKVRVTTDSFPGKAYDGTITFISSEAEFTPKSVQTEKERVKLVYRIKVTVTNPNLELKPGMPADGEILLARS